MMQAKTQAVANPALTPWWSVGLVWMVIAGPATVVVAGFATLAIAIMNPDPVYTVNKGSAAEMPAVQGRNHAATPQSTPP